MDGLDGHNEASKRKLCPPEICASFDAAAAGDADDAGRHSVNLIVVGHLKRTPSPPMESVFLEFTTYNEIVNNTTTRPIGCFSLA